MITKTRYYSKRIGKLPKGCLQCVKGEKIVIYSTGICARNCYFCPTSDEKTKNDISFANERKLDNTDTKIMINEIFEEVKRQNARGAGITGGDPLSRLERTVFIIKKLKERYGEKFHIHLYTILNLINEKTLSKLHSAGLDEIRFHPDLDNKSNWDNISLARNNKFSWNVGVEIPLIPGKEKETKDLLKFIENKVDFINLNELEIADNKANKLLEMGMETRGGVSYSINGSEELGMIILKFIQSNKIKIRAHYCTAKLKDKIQLTKRILRTGKNVKRKFEKITNEGLLRKGVVEIEKNNDKMLDKLYNELLSLNFNNLEINKSKNRIITSIKNAKKINSIKDKINFKIKVGISIEYPTYDSLCVEKEYFD